VGGEVSAVCGAAGEVDEHGLRHRGSAPVSGASRRHQAVAGGDRVA